MEPPPPKKTGLTEKSVHTVLIQVMFPAFFNPSSPEACPPTPTIISANSPNATAAAARHDGVDGTGRRPTGWAGLAGAGARASGQTAMMVCGRGVQLRRWCGTSYRVPGGPIHGWYRRHGGGRAAGAAADAPFVAMTTA